MNVSAPRRVDRGSDYARVGTAAAQGWAIYDWDSRCFRDDMQDNPTMTTVPHRAGSVQAAPIAGTEIQPSGMLRQAAHSLLRLNHVPDTKNTRRKS